MNADTLHGKLLLKAFLVLLASINVSAEAVTVKDGFKISALSGGLQTPLPWGAQFGTAILPVSPGAGADARVWVGAPGLDEFRGALLRLDITRDGQVIDELFLGNASPGLEGLLSEFDRFGSAIVSIGDLDGNGSDDLVVGAPGFGGDMNLGPGALVVLFMGPADTVLETVVIAEGLGGFNMELDDFADFGFSLASLGPGPGGPGARLVVGAPGQQGGAFDGAVFLIGLDTSGQVLSQREISADSIEGAMLAEHVHPDAEFGSAVLTHGISSGSSTTAILIGAPAAPFGIIPPRASGSDPLNDGSVVRLRLDDALSIEQIDHWTAEDLIFEPSGFYVTTGFGQMLALAGDLDGNGVEDILIGATNYYFFSPSLIFPSTVISAASMDSESEILTSSPLDRDLNGRAGTINAAIGGPGNTLAAAGDIDGDGMPDLWVGSYRDIDGALDAGAIHLALLQGQIIESVPAIGDKSAILLLILLAALGAITLRQRAA